MATPTEMTAMPTNKPPVPPAADREETTQNTQNVVTPHHGEGADQHHGETAAQHHGESPKTPSRITRAPFEEGPRRQLRRVGTKIGRKVLPFEKLLFRIGRLHVYRGAEGGFALRWHRPRRSR